MLELNLTVTKMGPYKINQAVMREVSQRGGEKGKQKIILRCEQDGEVKGDSLKWDDSPNLMTG